MDRNYNKDRNVELNQMIEESNAIPESLEYIKTRTKERVKKKRIAVFTGYFTGSIAALFLCFVLAINTSTVFAQTIYNIPALSKLVESVSWNKSFQRAFENDYAQYIGQKCVSGNTTLEVEYVIADKANVVLVMKFDKLDDEYEGKDMIVYTEDFDAGEETGFTVGDARMPLKENERFFISYSLTGRENKFYNNISVELALGMYDESGNMSQTGESFSFQLQLEEKAEEKVYNVNKPVDIGGQILYVDKVTVYPTCSKVSFRADDGNTEYIRSIELSITNEKGEVWTRETSLVSNGSLIDGESQEYYLGSDYFTSSEHLNLNIKSVFMLPKDMVRITLDLNNGTLTDSNGIVPDMRLDSVVEGDEGEEGLYIWIDCYEDYHMYPGFGWRYWFSDGTEHELGPTGGRNEDNGHYKEYLRNLEKPEDGIIILERLHPAYKTEVNAVVPIR